MTTPYRLYSVPGSGGMIVEAAFSLTDLPLEVIQLDWSDIGRDSTILRPFNPLGQVPTLIMPDGAVMTESGAILLHVAEQRPELALAPAVNTPERAMFLRWLFFIAGAIYPTFSYGDIPGRWVQDDADAAERLRMGTDSHREDLLRQMEAACDQPWFLGATMTAIDLYFLTIRHWRPHPEWFAENCPKLDSIGLAVAALDPVHRLLQRYWPE